MKGGEMSRNIVIEELNARPMDAQPTEIVERKGIGHPDSIADALAESVSRGLCRMYLDRYNRILHHNTDETQVVGGQSAPKFGGGTVLEPIYILLVGRATTEVNGERLPYRATAVKAVREYLEKNCPHLDLATDVTIDCRIGKGSVDLVGLYETKKMLANDTSFGVGFAPFSETERITYETERFINGPLKKELPETGQDVKVMAHRSGDNIKLTVAVAMVGKKIPDKDHYINTVQQVRNRVLEHAKKFTKRNVEVEVNTGDNLEEGIFYLTVTGLSMENADDGSVGRGNRANGLITPFRPMSLEATAGKNPVTHVGKLYNILSIKMANDIVESCGGNVAEAHVRILSKIGAPIDKPQIAAVNLVMAEGVPMSKVKGEVNGVVDSHLRDIEKLTMEIVNGKVNVF
jgi:S-adenosylmethionine synthetase